MIEFFNKLFGRQSSGATAKERLRLVLMSDHLSLAPEMVEAMKSDLVDVISRYVEVDREKIDIHFEHEDKALAMLANIPITGVNRSGNGKKEQPKVAPIAADAATVVGQSEVEATPPPRAPRRKRRKSAASSTGTPATGAPAPAT